MSKKRGRSKQKRAHTVDTSSGVPTEEILAEGSGPSGEIPPVQAADAPTDGETLYAVTEDGVAPDEALVEATGDDLASDAEPALEAVADESARDESADGTAAASASHASADGTLEAAGEATVPEGDDFAGAVTFEAAADGEPHAEPAAEGEVAEDDDPAAAALPTSAASFDAVQLKQLVEALVFASDKPITVQRLRQLTRVADVERLQATLAEITVDYENRGLILQQVSGGYQFRTRPQFSVWVQQLIQGRPVRLSRAQLETLAIVAYRQPITRPEIDDIRGVDSSATLKLLMDRLLIRVLGKKEEVGRPIIYGTTKEFLDFFSLGDLRELPTLREYSELSDESRQVITSRLGALAGSSGNDDGSGSDGGNSGGGGGDGGGDGGSSGPLGGDSSGGSDGGGDLFDASSPASADDMLRAYASDPSFDAPVAAPNAGTDTLSDLDAETDSESGAELRADSAPDADTDSETDPESDTELRADAEVSSAEITSSIDALDADAQAETELRADSATDVESELHGGDAGLVDADLVASAADTSLVASAIDAAFADVVRANPLPSSPLDDASPDELFADGSSGTDFPSSEMAAPEPMLAAGSMSNLAAVDEIDDTDDRRERAGVVPAEVMANDDGAEPGSTTAEPATE